MAADGGTDRIAPDVSFAELTRLLPAELQDLFPPHRWTPAKLWAVDVKVEPVEVADLTWMFGLPLWQLNGEAFKVTPNQVAELPLNFPGHYQRVMTADLDQPIHVVAYRGRLVVLDGIHRLLKAHFLRRRWIDAHLLTPAQLAGCAPGTPG